MILLAAAFTTFVIIAGLELNSGPVLTVVGLVVVGLFVFTLAVFYSFTIQIADGKLNFWFGYGVGKKSFAIDDIRSIEIVKTPWYYFWSGFKRRTSTQGGGTCCGGIIRFGTGCILFIYHPDC